MLQLANLGPAVKRKKTRTKGGAVVRTLAITAVTLSGLKAVSLPAIFIYVNAISCLLYTSDAADE